MQNENTDVVANISCPIPDCPVAASTRQTVSLGKDLARSVRRLRRWMKLCRQCPYQQDCLFQQHIDQQINQAIDDVLRMWKDPNQEEHWAGHL
jgi:hypothetical protein